MSSQSNEEGLDAQVPESIAGSSNGVVAIPSRDNAIPAQLNYLAAYTIEQEQRYPEFATAISNRAPLSIHLPAGLADNKPTENNLNSKDKTMEHDHSHMEVVFPPLEFDYSSLAPYEHFPVEFPEKFWDEWERRRMLMKERGNLDGLEVLVDHNGIYAALGTEPGKTPSANANDVVVPPNPLGETTSKAVTIVSKSASVAPGLEQLLHDTIADSLENNLSIAIIPAAKQPIEIVTDHGNTITTGSGRNDSSSVQSPSPDNLSSRHIGDVRMEDMQKEASVEPTSPLAGEEASAEDERILLSPETDSNVESPTATNPEEFSLTGVSLIPQDAQLQEEQSVSDNARNDEDLGLPLNGLNLRRLGDRVLQDQANRFGDVEDNEHRSGADSSAPEPRKLMQGGHVIAEVMKQAMQLATDAVDPSQPGIEAQSFSAVTEDLQSRKRAASENVLPRNQGASKSRPTKISKTTTDQDVSEAIITDTDSQETIEEEEIAVEDEVSLIETSPKPRAMKKIPHEEYTAKLKEKNKLHKTRDYNQSKDPKSVGRVFEAVARQNQYIASDNDFWSFGDASKNWPPKVPKALPASERSPRHDSPGAAADSGSRIPNLTAAFDGGPRVQDPQSAFDGGPSRGTYGNDQPGSQGDRGNRGNRGNHLSHNEIYDGTITEDPPSQQGPLHVNHGNHSNHLGHDQIYGRTIPEGPPSQQGPLNVNHGNHSNQNPPYQSMRSEAPYYAQGPENGNHGNYLNQNPHYQSMRTEAPYYPQGPVNGYHENYSNQNPSYAGTASQVPNYEAYPPNVAYFNPPVQNAVYVGPELQALQYGQGRLDLPYGHPSSQNPGRNEFMNHAPRHVQGPSNRGGNPFGRVQVHQGTDNSMLQGPPPYLAGRGRRRSDARNRNAACGGNGARQIPQAHIIDTPDRSAFHSPSESRKHRRSHPQTSSPASEYDYTSPASNIQAIPCSLPAASSPSASASHTLAFASPPKKHQAYGTSRTPRLIEVATIVYLNSVARNLAFNSMTSAKLNDPEAADITIQGVADAMTNQLIIAAPAGSMLRIFVRKHSSQRYRITTILK